MSTLLIGGPADGKRMNLPPMCGGVYKIASIEPDGMMPCSYSDACSPRIHTDLYYIGKFTNADGTTYEVATHSSVTDPMAALIKGYHYHRKPKRGW